MLHKNKIPVHKSGGEQSVRQIIKVIHRLEEYARAQGGKILAAGIAIPGVVYHETGLVWAPNIPGWDHLPLLKNIQKETALPLILESDRSAYVMGEQWSGIARGFQDVVFLAVGTGIGAGIITGGKLCTGSEDIAGAVGWFALTPEYREEYGHRGCFEAEASGDSVARRAVGLIRTGESSLMKEMAGGQTEKITAETVMEAARKNDPLALKVVDMTIQYLAMGIANIISILNPGMVVLGGGLFQASDLLLEPVRREFKRWAQPLAAEKVRIELSLLGEDAGLYGAGKLAWNHHEYHK